MSSRKRKHNGNMIAPGVEHRASPSNMSSSKQLQARIAIICACTHTNYVNLVQFIKKYLVFALYWLLFDLKWLSQQKEQLNLRQKVNLNHLFGCIMK